MDNARIEPSDIVKHFKRETLSDPGFKYVYEVIDFANHTETGEKLVVYKAMYEPCDTCARPYDMFFSEVDHEKYPEIRQKHRFEKLTDEELWDLFGKDWDKDLWEE